MRKHRDNNENPLVNQTIRRRDRNDSRKRRQKRFSRFSSFFFVCNCEHPVTHVYTTLVFMHVPVYVL